MWINRAGIESRCRDQGLIGCRLGLAVDELVSCQSRTLELTGGIIKEVCDVWKNDEKYIKYLEFHCTR